MDNSIIPTFDFEQGYHELRRKLEQEQLVSQKLYSSFKQLVEDRDHLKTSLSARSKEMHILQLKRLELEQKFGILTTAKKVREQTPKKSSKTSESLKKIGLNEDILLALPFGYSTKVRSAFEKLSYENDKLKVKLAEMESEEMKKIVEEKEQLVKVIEVVSSEKAAVEERAEDAKRQLAVLVEKNQWLNSVVATLGKEVVVGPQSNQNRCLC